MGEERSQDDSQILAWAVRRMQAPLVKVGTAAGGGGLGERIRCFSVGYIECEVSGIRVDVSER